MKVIAIAHQDPTTDDPKWLSVTFEPVESFEKPITLSQIKETPELANIGLVKQPRLSVMPLTKSEIDQIVARLYGLSDEEMQIIRGNTD